MLSEHPYYYTIVMIVYFIIYFGGIGVLAHMWRNAERERKREELNENEKEKN